MMRAHGLTSDSLDERDLLAAVRREPMTRSKARGHPDGFRREPTFCEPM
jgi:hypothetical protein